MRRTHRKRTGTRVSQTDRIVLNWVPASSESFQRIATAMPMDNIMTTSSARLLILSCSQRKRHQAGLMPAIERYDGPFFRVLRRYLRRSRATSENGGSIPNTYILSAEFGLIPSDEPIPDYERRMTTDRATELRPSVADSLQSMLGANTSCREIFVCMGREYQKALAGWEIYHPSGLTVTQAEGSLGGKQAQLHDWLCGSPPQSRTHVYNGTASIQGIEVRSSLEQVAEIARRALRSDGKGAADYRMWYVLVDDCKVSPKWLISQLTGLPVNKFHSDSARRFLAQLGVQVQRANAFLGKED